MKRYSERELVKSVAERWRNSYGRGPYATDERKQAIQAGLDALDTETASAEDVARVIGNTSWVEANRCNECGVRSWAVVQVGEEPDYESHTAHLCTSCLRAALSLSEA